MIVSMMNRLYYCCPSWFLLLSVREIFSQQQSVSNYFQTHGSKAGQNSSASQLSTIPTYTYNLPHNSSVFKHSNPITEFQTSQPMNCRDTRINEVQNAMKTRSIHNICFPYVCQAELLPMKTSFCISLTSLLLELNGKSSIHPLLSRNEVFLCIHRKHTTIPSVYLV